MRIFRRKSATHPLDGANVDRDAERAELEREKALAADRSARTDRVVAALEQLRRRNQFREQIEMTVTMGGNP